MTGRLSGWGDGLEGPARRIAQSRESPLRVLAGPGTGKTFSLMRRIMRLLEEEVEPRKIMVCTFTRTAARDLQSELTNLDVDGADRVRAGTVHAFCFSLLSRAEVLAATGRVPRPLLGYEERFLLEDMRELTGEGLRDLGRRLNAFAAAWARLQSDEPGWPQEPQDRAFLGALTAWLRFHEAMLVGELVPEALRFVRNNPESPHRPSFDHVLVDEYQDLNRAEQVLLDALAADGSFAVIGDEDQSIYSFKYAHPEGIARFDDGHPGTHDETLDECRRCPRLVVSMANALIANNDGRTPRSLRARPGNPRGEVHVVQWRSLAEEAEGLADFIVARAESGDVEPGGVLVLAPRRQFGYAIRDALTARGVPTHSFFHEEALDGNPCRSGEALAQEAFALLTLCARPDDRVALRCWCGFGSPSLNRGAWARVRDHAEEAEAAPRSVLRRLARGRLSLPRTGPVVERFRLLERRLAELSDLRGASLVNALFPDGEDWSAACRTIAADFDEDGDSAGLIELLQRGVTQAEMPTDVDYVRVMSLHKSKGLTAQLVVVAGCIEGLIPTVWRDLPPRRAQRALEEQRRLFYVAVTRTKKTLVLSSVTRLSASDAYQMGASVRGYGTSVNTIASRFLDELGPGRPEAVSGQAFLAEIKRG